MKKKLIVGIIAVTLICAFAGAGTMAYFTSRATSGANTFVAGTLVLGGVIDDMDVANRFATLNLANLKPGDPVHLGSTVLKNVGTLPFKLYRMTASNIVDASGLDGVLTLTVEIGGEQVFAGKLSQLVEENGGYFDPIYNVQPGEEKAMDLYVMMDAAAGNAYQGKSMTCDLTVYAAQNEMPLNGEPQESHVNLGTAPGGRPTFSVVGYNTASQVCFDWDWDPDDIGYEYYKLEIKHETGTPTTTIEEKRMVIIILPITREVVVSGDGIDRNDVNVDWNGDVVKIDKSAFPSDWTGFEVKLSGKQRSNSNIKSIPYQWWSLNR